MHIVETTDKFDLQDGYMSCILMRKVEYIFPPQPFSNINDGEAFNEHFKITFIHQPILLQFYTCRFDGNSALNNMLYVLCSKPQIHWKL